MADVRAQSGLGLQFKRQDPLLVGERMALCAALALELQGPHDTGFHWLAKGLPALRKDADFDAFSAAAAAVLAARDDMRMLTIALSRLRRAMQPIIARDYVSALNAALANGWHDANG